MNRLDEMLYEKKQFLHDGEILIYVKNGEMQAKYNDGDGLAEVNGKVNKKLSDFLDWLQDENQY